MSPTYTNFFPPFFYALILHALLFILVVIFELGGFSWRKDIELHLDQYAMQVDVVGLPDKTLKELSLNQEKILSPPPSIAPTSEQTPAPKSVETPKSEQEIKKQEEDLLLASLKEWKKKDVPQPTKSVESNVKPTILKNVNLQGLILKGNKISSGSLRPNMGISMDSPPVAKYIDSVILKIRQFWKLPSELASKNLTCRIRVGLDAQGRIQLLKIVQASNDPTYDQKALGAIESAAPFQSVPQEIVDQITSGSFILGFPL